MPEQDEGGIKSKQVLDNFNKIKNNVTSNFIQSSLSNPPENKEEKKADNISNHQVSAASPTTSVTQDASLETKKKNIENKLALLKQEIDGLDQTTPLSKIKALHQKLQNLLQEAGNLGISLPTVGIDSDLSNKENTAMSYQISLATQLDVEQAKKNTTDLLEVGRQLSEERYEAFKKLSPIYNEEQKQDVANLHSIHERLKAGKSIPQTELDSHILDEDQLKHEQNKFASLCAYHKDVIDHNNKLGAETIRLEEELQKREQGSEEWNEINSKLKQCKDQHTNHQKVKSHVDTQMQQACDYHKKKQEKLADISEHASNLPDGHKDKKSVEQFVAKKQEQQSKILSSGMGVAHPELAAKFQQDNLKHKNSNALPNNVEKQQNKPAFIENMQKEARRILPNQNINFNNAGKALAGMTPDNDKVNSHSQRLRSKQNKTPILNI